MKKHVKKDYTIRSVSHAIDLLEQFLGAFRLAEFLVAHALGHHGRRHGRYVRQLPGHDLLERRVDQLLPHG